LVGDGQIGRRVAGRLEHGRAGPRSGRRG
jgi:hypothetical protein